MLNDAINEIAKGLTEEQEDSLLAHAAISVSKAMEGADEATANRHASSFLLLLRAMEPEMFDGGQIDLPDTTLEKDENDETSWQTHLKDLMHDQGHSYFGPLEKHYWGEMGTGPGRMDNRGYGPRGAKNPKKSPTHSHKRPQKVHGRGSGKRTLMGYIRAYAKQNPDDEVPTWIEMKGMSHEEVIEIADDLGVLVETRGGNLNVVESDGDTKGNNELKIRGRDIADYVGAPVRGAGKNVTQESAARHIKHIESENKNLDDATETKRKIRDDLRRIGAKRRKGELSDKEKRIERGRRRYGTLDPNETRDKQPSMNRTKDIAQERSLRDKLKRTREISPKLHERDLPDAPQDDDKRKLPALPDPNDAGEAVDRAKRRELTETKPPADQKEVTPGEARPKGERPRQGSPFQHKVQDANDEGKVKAFEDAVRREKRLATQIKNLEDRGEKVPNALRVRRDKANIQRRYARTHLKDQGVDRNKLDRLQNATRGAKPSEGARQAVHNDLINRGGWGKLEETASQILDTVTSQPEGKRGGTFEGSTLEDHTAKQRRIPMPQALQDLAASKGARLSQLTDEEQAQVAEWTDYQRRQDTGYYVSFKGAEKVFDRLPTKDEVAEYLREHADKIKGNHFGMWQDGPKYVLDVTQHFQTMEEARVSGRENDQLAVWDIQNGRNLSTKAPEDMADDHNPAATATAQEQVRRFEDAAVGFRDKEIEAVEASLNIGREERPDPQQQALYDAEGPFVFGAAGEYIKGGAKGIQKVTDEIVNSAFWKKNFPDTQRVEVHLASQEDMGDAAADAQRMVVRLRFSPSKQHQTKGVLLHELAHIVTSNLKESHGPEYAANHLALVREFRGAKIADAMKAAYDGDEDEDVKVRVSPVAPGHFLPSDEKMPELNKLIRRRFRAQFNLTQAPAGSETRAKAQADVARLTRQIRDLEVTDAQERAAVREAKVEDQSERLSENTAEEAAPAGDEKSVTVPKNLAAYVGQWRAYYESAQDESESDDERKLSARMVEKLSETNGTGAAKLSLTPAEAESLADTIVASIDDVRNHLEDNVEAGTKDGNPAEMQAAKAHAERQNKKISDAQHEARLNRIVANEESRLRKLAAQIRSQA